MCAVPDFIWTDKIFPEAKSIGFDHRPMGRKYNRKEKRYDEYSPFCLFVRERTLQEIRGQTGKPPVISPSRGSHFTSKSEGICKMPSRAKSTTDVVMRPAGWGQTGVMGAHSTVLTPPPNKCSPAGEEMELSPSDPVQGTICQGAGQNCTSLTKSSTADSPEDGNSGEPGTAMVDVVKTFDSLMETDISKFPTLVNLRSDKQELVIALDSEWYYSGNTRHVLSWQFAVITLQNTIREYVFMPWDLGVSGSRLSLYDALSVILEDNTDILAMKRQDIRKAYYNVSAVCENGKVKWVPAWRIDAPTVEDAADIVYPIIKTGPASWEPADRPLSQLEGFDPHNPYKKDYQFRWTKKRLKKGVPIYPVTLLCHTGKVDLSTFKETQDRPFHPEQNILRYGSEVQGGLVSLKYAIRADIKTFRGDEAKGTYFYPVKINLRDTMCYAPAGKKSLANLGSIVKVPKVSDERIDKKHMDRTLREFPALFLKYASEDSVVTVLYAATCYGPNRKLPVTTLAAYTKSLQVQYMVNHALKKKKEFDRDWRGLKAEDHGKVELENGKMAEMKSMEAINHDAKLVQDCCAASYHGGINSSSRIGFFDGCTTYDYDLQSAYPTGMCLIPDIDWENPVHGSEILRRDLDLSFFSTPLGGYFPLTLFVGYCTFEFPKETRFPNIFMVEGGVPFQPRTSEGVDCVAVTGPEVYLALKLGAKVHCVQGWLLNQRLDENGKPMYFLKDLVKSAVVDRNRAKKLCGKKSLEDQMLKLCANGSYGKLAQNVIEKQTWTARTEEMEDMGASAITNPFSATYTTAIVRCALFAAMNELEDMGYHVYSVTTDGFICNAPEDVVFGLDLMGFATYLRTSRDFLTDGTDLSIWAIKHHQNALLNLTTRGNVAPTEGGVEAHNSFRVPDSMVKGSVEERLYFMDVCMGRTGPCTYMKPDWTKYKEMVKGKEFRVQQKPVSVSMDYDMKRKPDLDSLETVYPVLANGKTYEICNFNTIPYENRAEFLRYRQVKKKLSEKPDFCMRTEQEIRDFMFRVQHSTVSRHIKNVEWKKLFSVIQGYRAEFWDIPTLNDEDMSVQDKCDWIQKFNKSPKVFTKDDWKNAGKKSRWASMLEREALMDLLKAMGAVIHM